MDLYGALNKRKRTDGGDDGQERWKQRRREEGTGANKVFNHHARTEGETRDEIRPVLESACSAPLTHLGWPPPRSEYPPERSYKVLFDPALDNVDRPVYLNDGTVVMRGPQYYRALIDHIRTHGDPSVVARRIKTKRKGKDMGQEVLYRYKGEVLRGSDVDHKGQNGDGKMIEDEIMLSDPRKVGPAKARVAKLKCLPPRKLFLIDRYEPDPDNPMIALPSSKSTRVLMTGIPPLTPVVLLKTHYRKFGTIIGFDWQLDQSTGAALGILYLQFSTPEEARLCVEAEDQRDPSDGFGSLKPHVASHPSQEAPRLRAVFDEDGVILRRVLELIPIKIAQEQKRRIVWEQRQTEERERAIEIEWRKREEEHAKFEARERALEASARIVASGRRKERKRNELMRKWKEEHVRRWEERVMEQEAMQRKLRLKMLRKLPKGAPICGCCSATTTPTRHRRRSNTSERPLNIADIFDLSDTSSNSSEEDEEENEDRDKDEDADEDKGEGDEDEDDQDQEEEYSESEGLTRWQRWVGVTAVDQELRPCTCQLRQATKSEVEEDKSVVKLELKEEDSKVGIKLEFDEKHEVKLLSTHLKKEEDLDDMVLKSQMEGERRHCVCGAVARKKEEKSEDMMLESLVKEESDDVIQEFSEEEQARYREYPELFE